MDSTIEPNNAVILARFNVILKSIRFDTMNHICLGQAGVFALDSGIPGENLIEVIGKGFPVSLVKRGLATGIDATGA